VPEAELYKYSTQLHSMTHGRGTFSWRFHKYDRVPPDIAKEIGVERAKEKETASK
jgi:elongation factor G